MRKNETTGEIVWNRIHQEEEEGVNNVSGMPGISSRSGQDSGVDILFHCRKKESDELLRFSKNPLNQA